MKSKSSSPSGDRRFRTPYPYTVNPIENKLVALKIPMAPKMRFFKTSVWRFRTCSDSLWRFGDEVSA